MKIDKKTIHWVSKLARLSLSREEEVEMETQLMRILDYMEVLGELDLKDVPPTSHTLGFTNVTRKDSADESFEVDVVKRMAPEWKNNHVVVPRVV